MRIAILQSGDLEKLALGGIDQYIKNIIRNREDNEITVFGTCVHGQYEIGKEYRISKEGLEYSFVAISDDSKKPLTKGYLMNEPRFLKWINEYDVIYVQRIELTLPFIFCKSSRNKLIQVVHGSSYYHTLHMNKIKSSIYLLLEHISICIAKKTYVVLMRDEFGVPYYQRKYPKKANRIKYTKIPVDTSIFARVDKNTARERLGLPTDKFIIMYGGRVENYPKRVFLFPDILEKLKTYSNDFHFIIVGSGNDIDELAGKFAEKGLMNNVTIAGYVEDRKRFVDYINASDVNINISEFEGTCTSSLESVACGTPIVSTDAGDIKLFARNSLNGYIIANSNNASIINDSVNSILKIKSGQCRLTDDYMRYECKNVVHELFIDFQR